LDRLHMPCRELPCLVWAAQTLTLYALVCPQLQLQMVVG
jgi:hypothetical protein